MFVLETYLETRRISNYGRQDEPRNALSTFVLDKEFKLASRKEG
jgi:hypothetical protein